MIIIKIGRYKFLMKVINSQTKVIAAVIAGVASNQPKGPRGYITIPKIMILGIVIYFFSSPSPRYFHDVFCS